MSLTAELESYGGFLSEGIHTLVFEYAVSTIEEALQHPFAIKAFVNSSGYDIRKKRDYALRTVTDSRNIELVQYLLDMKADVFANDNMCLRNASKRRDEKMVRLLIENKAYVRTEDDIALKYTVMYNNVSLIKFLLDHRADATVNDSILKHAIGVEFYEIVGLLRDAGATIEPEPQSDRFSRWSHTDYGLKNFIDDLLAQGPIIEVSPMNIRY
jgi:hypothetical protein